MSSEPVKAAEADPNVPAKYTGIGSAVLGVACWLIVMFNVRPRLRPDGFAQAALATMIEISFTMTLFAALKIGQAIAIKSQRISTYFGLLIMWLAISAASLSVFSWLKG